MTTASPNAPHMSPAVADKPSLCDIKNGKVVFKQKPISFEQQSETLQEIVAFRNDIEQRVQDQSEPLTSIPAQYHPLIAKLAHESDKTLPVLAKQIRNQLVPAQDEGGGPNSVDNLPLSAVEIAIQLILTRTNYGLDAPELGMKVPAAVAVWRWEVKTEYWQWLPKNSQDKALQRQQERIQAKKDLANLYEALPDEARLKISSLFGKGPGRAPKDSGPSSTVSWNGDTTPMDATASGSTNTSPSKSPEKTAKQDKVRDEKKAAREEKDKKALEAQSKSRNLMANFFKKPKQPSGPVPSPSTSPNKALSSISDYDRMFKPFVLKKDASLASVNWFRRPLPDVIVLDDDGPKTNASEDTTTDSPPIPTDSTEHLQLILSSLPPALVPGLAPRPHPRRRNTFKTHRDGPSVRDILTRISEAELTGNVNLVRRLHQRLSDRQQFPTKVISFHEDARPGYCGTWTRKSAVIGPRTPLARDALEFDYGYDSGEEWEEEPAGDADDVEDGEEEDAEAEDRDSDLDSWLVDDDEPVEPGSPPDPNLLDGDVPMVDLPPKRKAVTVDSEEKQNSKKRKVVVPLVAFAKGPCWEDTIGRCGHEVFKPYQIKLFNDTPFPVDPFTFVSQSREQRLKEKASVKASAAFAVPVVPQKPQAQAQGSSTAPDLQSNAAPTAVPKKPTLAPKNPFPDTHLPFLMTKITSLQAASLTSLVEIVYQELKAHKVKKNAIEAKVREIGEKCKDKKVWILKPTASTATPVPTVQ